MFRIGSLTLKNWLVMAPMAGITSLSFRLLVKPLGPALVTTEMVSAAGLARGQSRTLTYLKSDPQEKPLAVQLFGSDPGEMAKAAELAGHAGADLVDINMGCPVRKVFKTGAGSALMRDQRTTKRILTEVRKACSLPLTVKIRAGWSPGKPLAAELACLIEDCGADALTVHPRFVTQGFAGKADWSIIQEVKNRVHIPVIGNGDVFHPALALKMRAQTGCDGVMIGRGAVGNPWIFGQILDLDGGLPVRQPTIAERRNLIMEHFRLLSHSLGERRAAKTMRGLLIWYSKGLPQSSRFRGSITQIKDFDTLMDVMDVYFSSLEANTA
jgi:nifR3 family TIM-barrel protein